MDGKPAPADEPLTYMGYSRGKWVGNTLVIDTDHLNDKTRSMRNPCRTASS